MSAEPNHPPLAQQVGDLCDPIPPVSTVGRHTKTLSLTALKAHVLCYVKAGDVRDAVKQQLVIPVFQGSTAISARQLVYIAMGHAGPSSGRAAATHQCLRNLTQMSEGF